MPVYPRIHAVPPVPPIWVETSPSTGTSAATSEDWLQPLRSPRRTLPDGMVSDLIFEWGQPVWLYSLDELVDIYGRDVIHMDCGITEDMHQYLGGIVTIDHSFGGLDSAYGRLFKIVDDDKEWTYSYKWIDIIRTPNLETRNSFECLRGLPE